MYNKNIYKSAWVVVQNEDKLVIDSNERIAEKMEEEARRRKRAAAVSAGEEGFTGGLGAERIDALEYGDDTESGNVLKAPEDTEPEGPTLEEIRAQIDAELEAAREEVEQIKSIARSEIDAEKRAAIEEGRNSGYAEGLQMAQNEADRMKSELEAEKARLEAEYDQLIDELEPKFIDTITDIYRHIFNVNLENDKDILVHLIDSTLRRLDSSKTFIVHVSQDDYEYVSQQKKSLTETAVGGRGMVEVIEDITLRKNECMIETDGGIFDCGVGTQLEELTKKLKLLSFEKD
ncbi:MAG: hypothetical protein K2K46_10845 [Lachnospiraceae bacterium]|nr:hypothetical protein [Lachnospiraceae bacterium]